MNIKEIEDRLKGRPVGTIDKHRFFSVTIPLVEKPEGLCLLFEVRSPKLLSLIHIYFLVSKLEK